MRTHKLVIQMALPGEIQSMESANGIREHGNATGYAGHNNVASKAWRDIDDSKAESRARLSNCTSTETRPSSTAREANYRRAASRAKYWSREEHWHCQQKRLKL